MTRVFPCAAMTLLALTTGRASDAEVPRPEHPTPDAVRSHWANLNGLWEFRFDPRDEGVKAAWEKPGAAGFDRSIVVPFPWESELSKVHRPDYHGVAWYRREFTVPDDFPKAQRVWLRFGAVDWRADVWVNGVPVVVHQGGYTPFEADVTDALKSAGGKPSTVVVRVFDPTDPAEPTGKQVGWYTTTSGIWQTVWLEARPASRVESWAVRTEILPPSATFNVRLAGLVEGTHTLRVVSRDPGLKAVETKVQVPPRTAVAPGVVDALLSLPVADAKLWTPETPHLYDVAIELETADGLKDRVETYFGLRTIARGRFGTDPYERVLLNGKPVSFRLALDQSFNPSGVYTAPDDAFLKRDMELAKEVGLNGLRIHIKPDEPRRLYWADKLGLLLLEDMPNTWVQNEKARRAWEATALEAVVRDRNHPAIVAWVAFNETWGLVTGSSERYKADRDTQDWVGRMVETIRKLDPTRLVEDNSPCNYDHVEDTDLNSWHFYIDDHDEAARHVDDVVARTEPGNGFNYCPGRVQGTAPLINSEYGGVSAGGGDRDVSWCFRDLTTLLRRRPKIQGYVYTELADIEWEHNGFFNYDRTPKTFGYDAFVPGMSLAHLNGADFIGYGGPPCVVVKPGERVSVPVFLSHFSDRQGTPSVRWWVSGWNDDAAFVNPVEARTFEASWTPYGVVEEKPVAFLAPSRPFVGALALTLLDRDGGAPIAANFVNVVVKPDAPLPRAERRDDHEAVLRFTPGDYARRAWSGGFGNPPGKAYGRGKGSIDYRIKLPDAVVKAKPERLRLRLELASKAAREKVEFAEGHVNGQDYPQTDTRKWPSTFEVSLNGKAVHRGTLADDPADARGVLSHLNRFEHGSHGELVEIELKVTGSLAQELASGEPLRIRLAVPNDAKDAGGLCVFGADTGQYPFDPTLIVQTIDPLPSDLGVARTTPVAVGRLVERRSPVLADGEALEPSTWSYTTRDPGLDWTEPGFDDGAWARGKAGFGTPGTPGVRVHTPWRTSTIWLRTTIDLPKVSAEDALSLRIFHDEDVDVFVNGKRLFHAGGYVTAYRDVELDEGQKALFRPGSNTIAVSCRQTGGGQGVDLGLTYLKSE